MAQEIPLKLYKLKNANAGGADIFELHPDFQQTNSSYAASLYDEATPKQFYQSYTTNPRTKQEFES